MGVVRRPCCCHRHMMQADICLMVCLMVIFDQERVFLADSSYLSLDKSHTRVITALTSLCFDDMHPPATVARVPATPHAGLERTGPANLLHVTHVQPSLAAAEVQRQHTTRCGMVGGPLQLRLALVNGMSGLCPHWLKMIMLQCPAAPQLSSGYGAAQLPPWLLPPWPAPWPAGFRLTPACNQMNTKAYVRVATKYDTLRRAAHASRAAYPTRADGGSPERDCSAAPAAR